MVRKDVQLFTLIFITCWLTWHLCYFPAHAQVSIENGHASEFFSEGMYAPTEMAFDKKGNLFLGSGYEPTWPIGGTPTPIFKVFPDGTCIPFSLPISDPDALTVSQGDDVFVGSYGGVITHIDGITQAQSIWLIDSRLKNMDGLRFAPSGDLFAVAIDSAKVHKIDIHTKEVFETNQQPREGIGDYAWKVSAITRYRPPSPTRDNLWRG